MKPSEAVIELKHIAGKRREFAEEWIERGESRNVYIGRLHALKRVEDALEGDPEGVLDRLRGLEADDALADCPYRDGITATYRSFRDKAESLING